MAVAIRDHVRAVAAVLSLVSLALVFSAAGGRVPEGALPRAPEVLLDAIPHVNAAISLLAIGTIAIGWRAIRRGNVARHRRAMLASFGLFAAFLGAYLYRVSLVGTHAFPGPEAIRLYVYYPVLAVHMALAIVCIPLLYYALLLGITHSPRELPATPHRRVGRITAVLWLVSFALGVVVYLLLYVLY